jgi:uncharacterized protein YcfJ
MKTLVGATVLVSLLGVAAQAGAAPPSWSNAKKHRYEHRDVYTYARVVDVDRVRVEAPRRECWDEVREVRAHSGGHSKGGMVLGGIIGGVLGHQIGSGRGNDVATVAGTLIGASVGHDVSARRARYEPPREEVVERCRVSYDHEYEERIDGYDVTYVYDGREFRTRMPYDPGERIRVRVDVEPAE